MPNIFDLFFGHEDEGAEGNGQGGLGFVQIVLTIAAVAALAYLVYEAVTADDDAPAPDEPDEHNFIDADFVGTDEADDLTGDNAVGDGAPFFYKELRAGDDRVETRADAAVVAAGAGDDQTDYSGSDYGFHAEVDALSAEQIEQIENIRMVEDGGATWRDIVARETDVHFEAAATSGEEPSEAELGWDRLEDAEALRDGLQAVKDVWGPETLAAAAQETGDDAVVGARVGTFALLGGGDNTFEGTGDGEDAVFVKGVGDNELSGGAGSDLFHVEADGTNILRGGDHEDLAVLERGETSWYGEAGADILYVPDGVQGIDVHLYDYEAADIVWAGDEFEAALDPEGGRWRFRDEANDNDIFVPYERTVDVLRAEVGELFGKGEGFLPGVDLLDLAAPLLDDPREIGAILGATGGRVLQGAADGAFGQIIGDIGTIIGSLLGTEVADVA